MRNTIVALIRAYQRFLSPDRGYLRNFLVNKATRCAFYPSCSEYSAQAIHKHGILKGMYLSLRRILRCHPWAKPGIDQIP